MTTPLQLLSQLQGGELTPSNLKLISAFQLEAWKEGMTTAAEITGADAILMRYSVSWAALKQRKDAIIAARDKDNP